MKNDTEIQSECSKILGLDPNIIFVGYESEKDGKPPKESTKGTLFIWNTIYHNQEGVPVLITEIHGYGNEPIAKKIIEVSINHLRNHGKLLVYHDWSEVSGYSTAAMQEMSRWAKINPDKSKNRLLVILFNSKNIFFKGIINMIKSTFGFAKCYTLTLDQKEEFFAHLIEMRKSKITSKPTPPPFKFKV